MNRRGNPISDPRSKLPRESACSLTDGLHAISSFLDLSKLFKENRIHDRAKLDFSYAGETLSHAESKYVSPLRITPSIRYFVFLWHSDIYCVDKFFIRKYILSNYLRILRTYKSYQ